MQIEDKKILGGEIRLKKILGATIIFLAVFVFAVSLSAAKETGKEVGVVIIGGAEFKTADFYKRIPNAFKLPNGYVIGDKMQSKYQLFLMENDLLGEKIPRKNYLIDFTAKSGCSKVLFLVVDAAADHQNNPKTKQKNRLTVQVDAYLMDSFKIISGAGSVQESHSNTSDLRARREAFKKCIEEIAKSMKISA